MNAGAIRIGIVEDNNEFAKILAEYVGSHQGLEVSWVATDGEDAIAKISENSVDLLVLDIIMPYLDGIGVLERIRELGLDPSPKIIVLTALGKEGTAKRAIALGADYYMVKPFDMEVLVQRILQFATDEPSLELSWAGVPSASAKTKQTEVSRILSSFGLSPHVRGYKYLVDMIAMVIDDPDIRGRVTTELYPRVAELNRTSPQRVERAIRHSIRLIWDKGDHAAVERVFGHAVSTRRKPTNSEFIARISEAIRLGQV